MKKTRSIISFFLIESLPVVAVVTQMKEFRNVVYFLSALFAFAGMCYLATDPPDIEEPETHLPGWLADSMRSAAIGVLVCDGWWWCAGAWTLVWMGAATWKEKREARRKREASK